MAVAIPQDVATALGRPLSGQTETDQVAWWLDGVELLIVNRLGPVADLPQAAVRYVEAEVVAAKLRRHGTTESSITVAVDDGSVTRRYEAPVSQSDVSDEWWNLLDPDANTGSASIRPGFDPDLTQWSVNTPGDAYWRGRDGWIQ